MKCTNFVQQQLFNNSQLNNLELKNLALFPSNFTVSVSSGILNWANINFQEFDKNERIWELSGSGFNNQNYVFITYIIETPFIINFNTEISGYLTIGSSDIVVGPQNTNIRPLR